MQRQYGEPSPGDRDQWQHLCAVRTMQSWCLPCVYVRLQGCAGRFILKPSRRQWERVSGWMRFDSSGCLLLWSGCSSWVEGAVLSCSSPDSFCPACLCNKKCSIILQTKGNFQACVCLRQTIRSCVQKWPRLHSCILIWQIISDDIRTH